MSVDKIVNELDRLSADPVLMGKQMAYQHNLIQESFMLMSKSFLNELSIQAKSGSYVNGNMEIAHQALEIVDTLLTFQTQL